MLLIHSRKMYFSKASRFSLCIIFVPFIIQECESASTRIYFARCAYAGFTCETVQGKYRITYQCPSGINDVTFYLWQFKSPTNTENVTIRNCTNVRLSFSCTGDNRPITQILVANITNLFIVKSIFTHNPPTIIFENIENMENIPENTFSQIKRNTYKPGCFNPTRDFENLYFRNVSVGTISPGAFSELRDFMKFSWSQVKVERIQHLGVDIEFNKDGEFSVEKSNLEVLEHLAFKLKGKDVKFLDTKFVEIFSSGINGTAETFVFNINNVNNVQPYAISILSQTVQISDNRFEYLRAGAFEKISPGLLQNSQINFGNLKFTYDFSHNSINFVDAGSLNPDIQAYDNVATDLKFNRNALYCSCENLGWLLSEVGHGYNSALLEDFYETILADGHENVCSYTTCHLTLQEAKKLLKDGKCLQNITAENLCNKESEPEKPNNLQAVTIKPKKLAFKKNSASKIELLFGAYFSLLLYVNFLILLLN